MNVFKDLIVSIVTVNSQGDVMDTPHHPELITDRPLFSFLQRFSVKICSTFMDGVSRGSML